MAGSERIRKVAEGISDLEARPEDGETSPADQKTPQTHLEHHIGTFTQHRLFRRIDWNLFGEFCIELGDVVFASLWESNGNRLVKSTSIQPGILPRPPAANPHQNRLDRRLQTSFEDILPVHILKEWMRPNLQPITRAASKSLRHLPLHQPTNQVTRVGR
jgi:hypothetical protein